MWKIHGREFDSRQLHHPNEKGPLSRAFSFVAFSRYFARDERPRWLFLPPLRLPALPEFAIFAARDSWARKKKAHREVGFLLVEVGGVEPPSVNRPHAALHA